MRASFEIILLLVMFVLWIIIVVDMFKKKVCWGFWGLLTFFPTYYHVLKYYSGNKKIIAPGFIIGTLLILINAAVIHYAGIKQLRPFFADVSKNINIDCKYSGNFITYNNVESYFVWCAPSELEKVTFKGVDEMVEIYGKKYIEPMIPYYNSNIHNPTDFAIRIGVASPYKMVACFELLQGRINKKWATGIEKPCE